MENCHVSTLSDEIYESLKSYNPEYILKREAMNVLVKMLGEDDTKPLIEEFRSLDKDFTGSISAKQLKQGIEQSGKRISNSELDQIITNCDSQEEGRISYSDFLVATVASTDSLSDEMLWALFKYFDSDGTN
jgi:Ca2+-binding EF-hand superfamily protein